MKCPKCGHDNRDDARFCNACGAPLSVSDPDPAGRNPTPEGTPVPDPAQPIGVYVPPKPSKFRLALRALIAVLLFIGLMFLCQSCVISGYLSSLMMQNGMTAAAAQNGMVLSAETLQEMMNELIGAVFENIAVILLIANLLTLLLICLIFRLRRRNPAEEFALHFVNPLRLAEFAVLGSAVNVLISVALSYIPLPEEIIESFEATYSGLDGSNLPLEILAVVIAGPVVEEILFRGIAMTRLGPTFGGPAAVILSSLLFGLAHGTPIAVGYAFLLGILLALIFLRYRSILPCMIFHIFFNFTSYWLTRLGETAQTVVFFVSIPLALVLVISALVKYPRFDDVICDTAGCIRMKDPERQAVIDDVRRLRTKTDASAEEIEDLRRRWNEAAKRK